MSRFYATEDRRDFYDDFYDDHASCRYKLARVYEKIAEKARVQQVLQQLENGDLRALRLVRVDAFEDGLRIVVQ